MPTCDLRKPAVRKHMRPVSRLQRAGVQTVDGLCASVKRMPSAATRSRCGVGTLDSGL